ncbi:MAG: NAD(+) synthase [Vampirovibrio sp.]|nr:NAD(+) synthase [Vampirovibrio sp.]
MIASKKSTKTIPDTSASMTVETYQQWANTKANTQLIDQLEAFFKTANPTVIQSFCSVIDDLLTQEDHPTLDFIIAGVQALSPKRPLAFQQLAGIFQFNPIVGAVARNAKLIKKAILIADAVGLDLLVLPEMALMGYPLKDLIIRFPHLVDQGVDALHELALATYHTRVILGFVEPRKLSLAEDEPLIGKPYYISVAVLGNRQIQGLVRKSYLPTYQDYDDARTIEPASQPGIYRPVWVKQCYPHANDTLENGLLTVHGFNVGITICEDLWNQANFNTTHYTQPADCPILAYLSQPELDWHINVSASVSRAGKEAQKQTMLKTIVEQTQRPLLYVNAVGGQDECIFDGASRLYSEEGELLGRSKAFAQQLTIFQLTKETDSAWNQINALPAGMEKPLYPTAVSADCSFSSMETNDLARTYQSLILGIQDYFKKTGFNKAVLGISGGLDSAVTAVLLADALGAENVFGFSFPSQLTPEANQSDAEILAKNLGIGFDTCAIAPITQQFLTPLETTIAKTVDPLWGNATTSSFAKDNVQAMSRATMLRLVSNNYNALPVATSDKSELYMGYATINGDLSGALAPLGDVCKTKLRLLATWLNDNGKTKNAMPRSIIERPSGADLAVNPQTGALLTAEEALMPYVFLDEIIWRIEVLQQPFEDQLIAVFEYEQTHPLNYEEKRAWLEKFFQRMQFAVFKWQISPPILIVDGYGSLAKTAYRHPILATQCQWWNKKASESALRQAFEANRVVEEPPVDC